MMAGINTVLPLYSKFTMCSYVFDKDAAIPEDSAEETFSTGGTEK